MAARVQKPLKHQVMPNRIDMGDAQTKRDDGGRSRALATGAGRLPDVQGSNPTYECDRSPLVKAPASRVKRSSLALKGPLHELKIKLFSISCADSAKSVEANFDDDISTSCMILPASRSLLNFATFICGGRDYFSPSYL